MIRQGRLSRHKVSVGEPADGSPPKFYLAVKENNLLFLHTHLRLWARCPVAKIPRLHRGDPCSIHGGSIKNGLKDELVNIITNHIHLQAGDEKGSRQKISDQFENV